ncbi:hypothetical protein FJT64_016407 [Amphibalanus amphitrite]|uniref:Death domain-containing protein n=1 Tax=Amphibalanus amphitrite TaxID=1232801 RepID=A0A6A4XAE1_AMPAM|nr:uncharacterized protein LOC122389697 [Amphibalanus amphitrite]KAF0312974.1 hypothetical protein FJT64_016407 [Amphibalanus amphitrite]
MPGAGYIPYATRKANRLRTPGLPECAYVEMRRELEQHLQRSPPQSARFVAVVTAEERLREALVQRASSQQLLDVMERRWPHAAQRIHLVKQIAGVVDPGHAGRPGSLQAALSSIEMRYGLATRAPAPPADPPSLVVEPSLSTAPSLPPPCPPPGLLNRGQSREETLRHVAIRFLAARLTRSNWRSLASVLGMPIGIMDDLDRAASSTNDAVRQMLTKYFETPRLHCGDQIKTLMGALRELHLNMTADELALEMEW